MSEENNIPLPEEGDPKTGDKVKKDWNNYLDYLDKLGYKGKPELDKGGLGYQLFDEYVKNNPNTSLNREVLPVIRKELLNYRTRILDGIKNGKKKYAEGANDNNFMAHVIENEKTKVPDYPGRNLTITKFPDDYEFTIWKPTGEVIKSERKGFAYAAPTEAVPLTKAQK